MAEKIYRCPMRGLMRLLSGAVLALLLLVAGPQRAAAAELVMFEEAGCVWCARFNRDIAPFYAKTTEGQRAPLRRVDINARLPADIAFIQVERLTPLFVLVDQGKEVGRIRGYPGNENFFGLLAALLRKVP